MPFGVEERDRPVKSVEAGRNVAEEGEARAEHDLSINLLANIVVSLGELDQLAADPCCLVELAAVEVEDREAAQDRKSLGYLSHILGQRQCSAVGLLHFLRVTADRHQPSREARAQRDLVTRAIRRRRYGIEYMEEIVRELDGSVIAAAGIVQCPERVDEPVQLLEITGLDPVPPGREEIAALRR